MLIEIDPSEVTIKAERYDTGLNVLAIWRDSIRAGIASCRWDNNEKMRLLICDMEVKAETMVQRKRLFRQERRATFRGLGIGKRLLREVIQQARLMGARELFGKVVESDLKNSPGLLDWYAREGFEIGEPIEGDMIPHMKSIVMNLD